MLDLEGQIKMEDMCFFCQFLKMGKDSDARIELGRLFHQEGIINIIILKRSLLM